VPNGFLFGARAALLRTAGKGSDLSRPPERRGVENARECERGPYWEEYHEEFNTVYGNVGSSDLEAIRLRNPGICAARQYTRNLSVVQRAYEILDLLNAISHSGHVPDLSDLVRA
jgi:hypothetical protein